MMQFGMWHYKIGHSHFQTNDCFYDTLGVIVGEGVIVFQHRATAQLGLKFNIILASEN